MNAVAFYSSTGQSRRVAEFFSEQLGYPLIDVESTKVFQFEDLVLVFPVYCQNIPKRVCAFLNRAEVVNLTVVATYGKMCHGNVLYEIQNKYKKNIVAAAYVPTKHTYLQNDEEFRDFEKLAPVVKKVAVPETIELPKTYKNIFADLFPDMRGRAGVKILKSPSCIGCGICTEKCSFGAIDSGKTNKNCIRCLKCVSVCPRNALKVKIRMPLRIYLGKKKSDKVIIYV